jgi:hypothetical protein
MRAFIATFALMIPTVRTDTPIIPPRMQEGSEPSGFGSYIPYAAAGGWNVVVDASGDPTCFVIGTFRSGITMRFGIDEDEPASLYVVVADPKWKDVEPDRDYEIGMRLDGHEALSMRARSGVVGASPSLTIHFSDPVQATRFAMGSAMILRKGTTDLARIDLGTPAKALMEMAECRRDMKVLAEALRAEDGGETSADGEIA